jgi:hypothetical protein
MKNVKNSERTLVYIPGVYTFLALMDKKSDYRLDLIIEPLKIAYDSEDVYLLANNQSNCRMF